MHEQNRSIFQEDHRRLLKQFYEETSGVFSGGIVEGASLSTGWSPSSGLPHPLRGLLGTEHLNPLLSASASEEASSGASCSGPPPSEGAAPPAPPAAPNWIWAEGEKGYPDGPLGPGKGMKGGGKGEDEDGGLMLIGQTGMVKWEQGGGYVPRGWKGGTGSCPYADLIRRAQEEEAPADAPFAALPRGRGRRRQQRETAPSTVSTASTAATAWPRFPELYGIERLRVLREAGADRREQDAAWGEECARGPDGSARRDACTQTE